MRGKLMFALLLGAFGASAMSGISVRDSSDRGKETPALTNKRNASKSQRVMLAQRGHRNNVGARAIERRAKHAIKGTPCNSH